MQFEEVFMPCTQFNKMYNSRYHNDQTLLVTFAMEVFVLVQFVSRIMSRNTTGLIFIKLRAIVYHQEDHHFEADLNHRPNIRDVFLSWKLL